MQAWDKELQRLLGEQHALQQMNSAAVVFDVDSVVKHAVKQGERPSKVCLPTALFFFYRLQMFKGDP